MDTDGTSSFITLISWPANQKCAKPPSLEDEMKFQHWPTVAVVLFFFHTCWQFDDARRSFLATTRVTTTAKRQWGSVRPVETSSHTEPHSDDGRSTCPWLSPSRRSSWRQALVNPACFRWALKLCRFTAALRVAPCENDAVVKPVGLTLPELDHIRLDNVAAPVGRGHDTIITSWELNQFIPEHLSIYLFYWANFALLTKYCIKKKKINAPTIFHPF